jgi:hypothetical protein
MESRKKRATPVVEAVSHSQQDDSASALGGHWCRTIGLVRCISWGSPAPPSGAYVAGVHLENSSR